MLLTLIVCNRSSISLVYLLDNAGVHSRATGGGIASACRLYVYRLRRAAPVAVNKISQRLFTEGLTCANALG